MDRRSFVLLSAATLAGTAAMGRARGRGAVHGLDAWLSRFKSFPGSTSFRIDIGGYQLASDSAATQFFVASSIKTFILCQYLRDVEAGVLSEDEQLPVNDSVRAAASPLLLELTGTTPARSILEAMITHSDNTATDIALLRVGPDRVRSLIAALGLGATLIPDSTRRFFSYNAGAPFGVDIGWSGVQAVLKAESALGPPHRALNDLETLASSADDLVSYYKQALAGTLFSKHSTLSEFKRILLTNTFFPDDTVGYGKGGSGDWFDESLVSGDFHAISYAGQMVVDVTPVTFCFIVNWMSEDPQSGSEDLAPAFTEVVKGSMEAVKALLRPRAMRGRYKNYL
jgi:beta-lactamase class A